MSRKHLLPDAELSMIHRMFAKVTQFSLVVGVALTAIGCKHYPVNEPLVSRDTDNGYYFHLQNRPNNSEELLVILAFSGGGTRAAALSFGVLEALRAKTITIDGEERSLLDEVDAISSVSGGSFTAAAKSSYWIPSKCQNTRTECVGYRGLPFYNSRFYQPCCNDCFRSSLGEEVVGTLLDVGPP